MRRIDTFSVLAFALMVLFMAFAFWTLRTQQPDLGLADNYAGDLHTGHKIAVRYSVAVAEKDNRAALAAYEESEAWVKAVRMKLRHQFGSAIEELWALGKNHYPLIGESARHDHDARVWKLADLIGEMRSGRLVRR